LSSSTFFSSGGGGLRFPACASGCPSTPNIVPEAVAAINHLQHNHPNTFLHESRSNVYREIRQILTELKKFHLELQKLCWCIQACTRLQMKRNWKKSYGRPSREKHRLCSSSLVGDHLQEKNGVIQEENFRYYICDLGHKLRHRHEERGTKPTYERHQKQLLGIGRLPADIQAGDKPWSRGWVCIQPHLCCGIHTVLIAKQWSKRIQKLTSPLLPLQVPWRSSSHFISANQEQC
jgi:hypothetical protein